MTSACLSSSERALHLLKYFVFSSISYQYHTRTHTQTLLKSNGLVIFQVQREFINNPLEVTGKGKNLYPAQNGLKKISPRVKLSIPLRNDYDFSLLLPQQLHVY